MRALVSLIFVFGAVAIAYAIHWSRKAASAVNDASVILKQTGSITETARQMLLERNLPDAMRLSLTQRAYLSAHQDEFRRVCGAAIEAQAQTEFARWQARHRDASRSEIEGGVEAAFFVAGARHARMFCEMRGVL